MSARAVQDAFGAQCFRVVGNTVPHCTQCEEVEILSHATLYACVCQSEERSDRHPAAVDRPMVAQLLDIKHPALLVVTPCMCLLLASAMSTSGVEPQHVYQV